MFKPKAFLELQRRGNKWEKDIFIKKLINALEAMTNHQCREHGRERLEKKAKDLEAKDLHCDLRAALGSGNVVAKVQPLRK